MSGLRKGGQFETHGRRENEPRPRAISLPKKSLIFGSTHIISIWPVPKVEILVRVNFVVTSASGC